ncbi:hypothetical protein ABB37_02984 [Leptomonas pyrrhocoris]|uniref:Uncharacterized protein n=1 Tax=Leptomonas pyrrhocoris TaxID=157538 RepID=A0A0M9G6K6_LEPPY|nr:hypothetical protein ABB37_02984 [Leptomonas pyrrhocoris]KPA83326.1 hypothetical protein ABB37_02984 [Leptomonas pyrrhocoris]|eukprot:XP_015661765.1 hypothetical protein ABB37_02984 [Leptomonas pyrrhocoris]
MLSSTNEKAVDRSNANEDIASPNQASYILYDGLNWVSFVSSHPFEVVAVSSTSAASNPHANRTPQRRQYGNGEAVAKESAALVAAQLPRVALSTSRSALRKALPASETPRIPANKELATEKCYVASLWCLQFSTSYKVTLTSQTKTPEKEAPNSAVTQLTFQTLDFRLPVDLREQSPHIVERGSLLFHPEFVQCIAAQGESEYLFYLPTNPLDARTALPFMHALWYHGLFTLPQPIPCGPQSTLLLLLLPNSDERYVLDLASPARHNTSGAPVESHPLTRQRADGQTDATGAANDGGELPEARFYPWRGHSKVRRVIRAGTYTVVVRDDAAGVTGSLQRAYEYHLVQHEASWLDPAFIRLMGSCCEAAPSQDTFGVRLVCVELVDEAAAEVVAGCCGMAIGSVYHDYTMYTVRRCKDSLGTFLTKLLGEALQRCGYTLWYWGLRLGYMAEYEKHFGAVAMSRNEFYARWCAARDVAPACAVETYLRSSKGMVLYTSKAV